MVNPASSSKKAVVDKKIKIDSDVSLFLLSVKPLPRTVTITSTVFFLFIKEKNREENRTIAIYKKSVV